MVARSGLFPPLSREIVVGKLLFNPATFVSLKSVRRAICGQVCLSAPRSMGTSYRDFRAPVLIGPSRRGAGEGCEAHPLGLLVETAIKRRGPTSARSVISRTPSPCPRPCRRSANSGRSPERREASRRSRLTWTYLCHLARAGRRPRPPERNALDRP